MGGGNIYGGGAHGGNGALARKLAFMGASIGDGTGADGRTGV